MTFHIELIQLCVYLLLVTCSSDDTEVLSPFALSHEHSADFREEDGSDDNRSPSLGRSAPSDDASVASDYQDDGAPECKLTAVLILMPRMFLYTKI